MARHPLTYTKENLNKIMNKPLRLGIGKRNSDEITEVLEGQIVKCTLASNPPHLPAIARFETNDGELKRFDFFEIKQIEILEN